MMARDGIKKYRHPVFVLLYLEGGKGKQVNDNSAIGGALG